MKETTITNYVCHPRRSGGVVTWQRVVVLSVLSVWWWMMTRPGTRAWASSRCWSPSQSGSSGSASSLITECRAAFLSCFCHHLWWWSPVTLHTIRRQHAGEIPSLGPKLRSEYRRSSWKCMFQLINITIIKIKEVWAAVHMVCGLIFVTVGAWSYSGTKALQWDLKIYCSESNTRDRVQPRNPGLAFYEAECGGIDKALDSRHAILVFRPSSCPNTARPQTNSNWQFKTVRLLLAVTAKVIVIHNRLVLFSDYQRWDADFAETFCEVDLVVRSSVCHYCKQDQNDQ